MSKESQMEHAEDYIAEGKYGKALKIYSKLVARDALDLRLQLRVADLYVKLRQVSRAIESYQRVASFYEKEEFHLKAIAIYKLMLKMNPTLININERLGNLSVEVGMRQDAIRQYMIVSHHYEQLNDVEQLVEIRRKIVDAEPLAMQNRIRLAEVYQKNGRVDEAMQEYEKVAADMEKRGDTDGLAEIYQKLLFHRPDQIHLLIELSRLYIERGDAAKALERIEAVQPSMRDEPVVQELCITIYLDLEQRENARRVIKEIYERCSDSGDNELAGRIYAKAIEEFADDLEYIDELDAMKKAAGLQHQAVPRPVQEPRPERRDEPPPTVSAPGLHDKVSEADLEKTVLVRVDDLPPAEVEVIKPLPESPAAKPTLQPVSPQGSEVDLESTVMITEEELRKQEQASAEPDESIKSLEDTVMIDLAEFEKYMEKQQKT